MNQTSSKSVTRLGEFLPIGRLFSLSSFFLITEVAEILGLFSDGKNYVGTTFARNMLSYILGDFFKLIWSPWCPHTYLATLAIHYNEIDQSFLPKPEMPNASKYRLIRLTLLSPT
jgi:hypothetical protein